MSRSSRSSAPTVNLFPFLAVLLCMMGALVFLLIALSEKVGVDPVAVALVDDSQETEAAVVPTFNVDVPEPIIIRPPLQLPEPVIHEADVVSASKSQSDVDQPLIDDIARLRSKLDELERSQQTAMTAAASIEAEIRAAETANAALLAKRQTVVDQRSIAEAQVAKAKKALADALAKLTTVNDELEDKLAVPKARKTAFRILPYDRTTGTQRHPIVIECTAKGYRFALEGVDISVGRFRDATFESNPLVDGINELIAYYSKRGERPYVLLILYPDGHTPFYVAKAILNSNHRRWGYELVPDGMALDWPKAPTSATMALQETVDRERRRRGRALDTSGDIFAEATQQQVEARNEVARLAASRRGPYRAGMPGGAATGVASSRSHRGPTTIVPPSPDMSSIRLESVDANRVDASRFGSESGGQNGRPSRLEFGEDARKLLANRADGGSSEPLTQPRNARKIRRWGKQSPDQWIGYERQVFVTMTSDRISWNDVSISGLGDLNSQQIADRLAELLDVVSLDWDPPNARMHWRPTLVASEPSLAIDSRIAAACELIEVGFRRVSQTQATKLAAEQATEVVR